ncbi:MAG: CUAEP/CCAEP-tail radical SAM protein [Acidimicrobiales bacterium]
MRILLVSTYELGHQPLHVASPAAVLLAAGHDVRCHDLSVEPWDESLLDDVDALALSVPMHTAMRLAVAVATGARERRPDLPVCFYGLYAPVGRDATADRLADRVIAGEYEPALVSWLDELAAGSPAATDESHAVSVHLGRGGFRLPARHLLPPLEQYAGLAVGDEERLAGYVEASHGCTFRCRHCPVPTVYDGRLRIVDHDVVVADVDGLVAAGARHLTFGDPDFLNGVQHSLRLVRAIHERHPDLTFDITTKVELVLRHAGIWPELAASGLLFATSAVECVNDAILDRLDKGHTAADAAAAIRLLRGHGIELRPSLLPFTPWTTLDDMADLVDFAVAHDLGPNIEPVHWTIRLLLPEGSLLLDHPDLAPHLRGYDVAALGYRWDAVDPQVDALQASLAALVEADAAAGVAPAETFAAVVHEIRSAAGRPSGELGSDWQGDRPRLTEAWFCCAEPTAGQLDALRPDDGSSRAPALRSAG